MTSSASNVPVLSTLLESRVQISPNYALIQFRSSNILHAVERVLMSIVLNKAKAAGCFRKPIETHDKSFDLSTSIIRIVNNLKKGGVSSTLKIHIPHTLRRVRVSAPPSYKMNWLHGVLINCPPNVAPTRRSVDIQVPDIECSSILQRVNRFFLRSISVTKLPPFILLERRGFDQQNNPTQGKEYTLTYL